MVYHECTLRDDKATIILWYTFFCFLLLFPWFWSFSGLFENYFLTEITPVGYGYARAKLMGCVE